MRRVPPSTRTREAIEKLLREGTSDDPKSALARLAMQLIVEEAHEAKVRDLLGREYYEHGQGEERGYRNGYRTGRLKTAEGEVRYAAPQVRDTEAGALAELRAWLTGRTEALEALALEMYARGCSTRDIEAAFRDDAGRSLLSRQAVSELTERLWAQYEEFATRDLTDLRPLYLFLDGIAERLTPGFKREAVLCAWALVSNDGKSQLITEIKSPPNSSIRDTFQGLTKNVEGFRRVYRPSALPTRSSSCYLHDQFA